MKQVGVLGFSQWEFQSSGMCCCITGNFPMFRRNVVAFVLKSRLYV